MKELKDKTQSVKYRHLRSFNKVIIIEEIIETQV